MFHYKSSAIALSVVLACSALVLGFTNTPEEDKNTAAMKRFYDEVMNKNNLKALDELVADNYVEHSLPDPSLPENKAGLTQMMTMLHTAYPDLQITILDLAAKGDKVWVYSKMHGTNTGAMLSMPPTGKKIEVTGFDVVRFVNGKAVEHWGLNDDFKMMQQLGFIPAPGEAPAKQ